MQYKLKESQKDDTTNNPKDIIIEKYGDVHEFTIRQFEDNIKMYEKPLIEMKAQLALDAAKKENIEEFHPFVLTLTEEQLLTCHMYAEACSTVRVLTPKIKEIEDGIDEEKAQIEEVYKQIPSIKKAVDAVSKENAPVAE